MSKLGDKIKELRKKNGMSQKDLADAIGVSRQALSSWENDTYQPDYDSIISLCKVLNVDANTLYDMEPTLATIDEKQAEQQVKENTSDNDSKATRTKKIVKTVLACVGAVLLLIVGAFATMPFLGAADSNKVYSITFELSDEDKLKIFAIVCFALAIFLVVKIIIHIRQLIKTKKQESKSDE